jgi:cell division protein FtsB
MRAVGSVWLRRLGIAALVALALGYVPYHLYGSSGLARYIKLKDERDALHESNLKLYEANQQLRAQLEALSDEQGNLSPVAVERAARDELGLVKAGEVVYQVGDTPVSAVEEAAR